MATRPHPGRPVSTSIIDPIDGPLITGFSINGPNDESVLWYCEYSSVENVADVPLITAAPNMLAVCRNALRELEREVEYRDLQAELRDVIAYAERDVDCGNGFVIATRDGVCSLRDAAHGDPAGDPD